jgi:hypothetical protein
MNSTIKQLLDMTDPLVNMWFKMLWSSCLQTAYTGCPLCVCVCVSIMGMSKRMAPNVLRMAATKLMVILVVALSCCKNLYFFFSSPKFKKNGSVIWLWYLSEYTVSKKMGPIILAALTAHHIPTLVKQQHLMYKPLFICWPVSWHFGHSYDHYIINICKICWQQTDCNITHCFIKPFT